MLGGHAVAQCLQNEGVRHVFSVPGKATSLSSMG